MTTKRQTRIAGYDEHGIPMIEATRTPGGGLRFWCDHCRGWHLHGGGYGHRVNHCWRPASPFARGYTLVPEKKDQAR